MLRYEAKNVRDSDKFLFHDRPSPQESPFIEEAYRVAHTGLYIGGSACWFARNKKSEPPKRLAITLMKLSGSRLADQRRVTRLS